MKKNAHIHLNLSQEDLEKIKAKAELCRLSLNAYCTFVLSNVNPNIVQELFKEK